MTNKNGKILNLILPILSVGAVLLFWLVASIKEDNAFILPSITKTVESLFALFLTKDFYVAFLTTFLRSLIAFAFSFSVGFVLAFLSSKNGYAKKVIDPIIAITRALPTIAVVLLLLLWTNSQVAPVVVTTLVVLPTSYTNMYQAFTSMDKTVLEAGLVDGADKKRVFLWVEFPMIAPAFYGAIGSGISLNFKLMVAAEVIAQTARSMGYLLNTSKAYFETATMMALVLVSVIVGVVIESTFNALAKKFGAWR